MPLYNWKENARELLQHMQSIMNYFIANWSWKINESLHKKKNGVVVATCIQTSNYSQLEAHLKESEEVKI